MSVTQYYKEVKLSPIEVAVINEALVALLSKLEGQLDSGNLPAISVANMRIEIDAAKSVMTAMAHAKFAAVNVVVGMDFGEFVTYMNKYVGKGA